ncbi:MAG: MmcQ/YjbR family DNA-binding protein [Planctomycetia bacterium]|nr:MmcQ/YjbR family DNA-binding protein [Planctomycetia bacterium]
MKKTANTVKKIFKNRKAIPEKLLQFGFDRKRSGYSYSADLLDGQLLLTILIGREGEITADIVPVDPPSSVNSEKRKSPSVKDYLDEYEEILDEINDFCFEYDAFHSPMSRKIIAYIEKKYQGKLEYLWKRSPDNAIFREKKNGKWYAALLTVDRKKLRLPGEGTVEIIDLKAEPDNIPLLLDRKKYFPGYHMNKLHWITICLDGSVPFRELCKRVDESFALAAKIK